MALYALVRCSLNVIFEGDSGQGSDIFERCERNTRIAHLFIVKDPHDEGGFKYVKV
jgi:hypothetical protein